MYLFKKFGWGFIALVLSFFAGCSDDPSSAEDESEDYAGSVYDDVANTLMDLRDGQVYKTVTFGEQVWMAENLNYKTKEGSFCKDDNPANCSLYGRTYQWPAAMKACPRGWRMPTPGEWIALFSSVYGMEYDEYRTGHLKISPWIEDDSLGLSLVSTHDFSIETITTYMWTSDGSYEGKYHSYAIWIGIFVSNSYNKPYDIMVTTMRDCYVCNDTRNYVRCVKDEL